jgi:hypothetical protein
MGNEAAQSRRIDESIKIDGLEGMIRMSSNDFRVDDDRAKE